MLRSPKKILYIEGSPYANYSPDPSKNVGGSIISLNYMEQNLNNQKYKPSLFLLYDSHLIDRTQGHHHMVLNERKEYGTRRSKKPVQIFFSRDFYLFLSYLKMSLFRMVPSAVRMYSYMKKERPDIVHCNNSLRMNMDAILASRLAGIPCICHVRSYEKLYFINKLISGFVKYFICISEAVRDNYLNQGINRKKLVLIPNGLDVQDFPILSRRINVGQDFVIVAIGRMVEWKGHDVLLRAIPRIVREKKNVQFWIVGDGRKRAELEEMALDLNISLYVKFKGIAQDIRTILSEADLLVHTPTQPEPFGRVVIEAMAMQKPVIATNMGGPKDIITDGQDGILIESNAPDRLADAILQILDNPDWRLKIGNAARETIEKRYDIKKVVQQIERIYDALMAISRYS